MYKISLHFLLLILFAYGVWEAFWNNATFSSENQVVKSWKLVEKPDPAASGVGSIKLVSSCRRKGFAEYKVKCLQ